MYNNIMCSAQVVHVLYCNGYKHVHQGITTFGASFLIVTDLRNLRSQFGTSNDQCPLASHILVADPIRK